MFILLQLTTCEQSFHLYVLDSGAHFSSDADYNQSLLAYCGSYTNNSFLHTQVGKRSLPRRQVKLADTPQDEEVPEGGVYNRWNVPDYKACGADDFWSDGLEIFSIADLPERFRLTETDIPKQLFLPEYGLLHKPQDQGTCGSCYAMTSRTIFQSLMKWNLPFYKEHQIKTYEVFNEVLNDASQFLSVQYLMNNTHKFGINDFCSGGTYEHVAQYYYRDAGSTQELNSNYPYKSMLQSEKDILKNKAQEIEPKIDNDSYDNPFYWYSKNDATACPIGMIVINPTDWYKGWDAEQAKAIKMLLSHGIPLAGQMNFNGSGKTADMMAFQFYTGGLVQGDCALEGVNHQVTLVGFGTYKGNEVWVFMNSWGTSFGIHGFYYVKIGSNAMCHETGAIAVFPRYFRYLAEDRGKPFTQTKNYQENKHIFFDPFATQIRRGLNGLDNDDGTFTDLKFTWQAIILIIIMIVFCLFIVYHGCVATCCPEKLVFKPSVYVKFNEDEMKQLKWESNCVVK